MLALLALVLAAATPRYHPYAETPQAAALAVESGPDAPNARVVRTNVAGRYATVLTTGGEMESVPFHAALIVERFPFGWQPIGTVNTVCPRTMPPFSADERRILLAGMPSVSADHACDYPTAGTDVGPASDVAAVRQQMNGRIVPSVRIVGDFALGDWCCPGGGETLFRRNGRVWIRLVGGGGMIDAYMMQTYHVPPASIPTLRYGH